MQRVCAVPLSMVIACSLATGVLAENLPDADRVAELARWLPDSPQGVGRPITDRAAWQAVAEAPAFREVVAEAEELIKRPLPEASDELYLEFSRTGNRTRYQRVQTERHSRFAALTVAECIENRGRFLPAIEEAIRELKRGRSQFFGGRIETRKLN